MRIISSFKGLLHETIDFVRGDFSWTKCAGAYCESLTQISQISQIRIFSHATFFFTLIMQIALIVIF